MLFSAYVYNKYLGIYEHIYRNIYRRVINTNIPLYSLNVMPYYIIVVLNKLYSL